MVFSSLPSFLDHPNWPQQPTGGVVLGVDHEISQLPPQLMPPPHPGSGGEERSMHISDRGRIMKMPQPDTTMKCPRCESTNTKFCYFNNYSLSQPRHFCKTCRRYWTRGGALRSVPVGGGCRRNKKSKGSKGCSSSRSKSPSTTISSTSNPQASPTSCATDILGHLSHNNIRPPQFPILPSLPHYGGGDLGLTFGSGSGTNLINLGHDSNYPSNKFSHFPFLGATNGGMYGEGPSNYAAQLEGMKMEENNRQHQQGLNLSRNFLGMSENDPFLGTSNVAWATTDISGFTSSSTTTTHLL